MSNLALQSRFPADHEARTGSGTGTGTAPGADGIELFYRWWQPAPGPGQGQPANRAVLLFHGGHEHSGRFDELVAGLATVLPGCAFFAWDARGHGRSPGERGDAAHFMELVRDADCFVSAISERHGIAVEDMAVLGHSVGSVTLATWLLDYARPVRAAVLGSPAFDIKLYVPLARSGLKLMQRFNADAYINSYVRPSMLTHDREEAVARAADPLISPRISVRVLTSLYDTAERVVAGAEGISTPTLVLSAGNDWVVHQGAQRRFFEGLGSTDKVWQELPGYYHEVFHEQQRRVVIEQAAEFLARAFEGESALVGGPVVAGDDSPVAIERCGAEAFKTLSQPLPLWSPRRWGWALTRLGTNTVGRLSDGVRLGWQTGFESGRSLNYVYDNQPRGRGPLGRAIDRAYLASPGWVGIRRRGEHLRGLLADEIGWRRQAGRKVHVLDVAGGPGRYLVETLAALRDAAVTAQCRDLDEAGLQEGRELAASRQLSGLLYSRADAFDPRSYESLLPRPDIVVISGLFELFDDNERLLAALTAVHAALPDDGSLIVTNQPHHPQLEFIARVLDDRYGRPWVMRPRPQAELEALLAAAGFASGRRLIDDQGIFSVNLAHKVDGKVVDRVTQS